MSFRTCIIMLCLGLLASSIWGAGVFGYLGYYNLSGKYQDVKVSFNRPSGLMLSDGLIYVADTSAKAVWVINSSDAVVNRIPSGSGNLLDKPMNLMKSGGVIYIADAGQGGVIAYTGSNNALTIGPSMTALRMPFGVWVENGSMWILDNHMSQVMEYDLASGRNIANLFGLGIGVVEGSRFQGHQAGGSGDPDQAPRDGGNH